MLFDDFNSPQNHQRRLDELIARYEDMRSSGTYHFFDSEAFEEIIEYYLDENKLTKASKAINLALESYPFVGTFFLRKAQLELMYERPAEALPFVEKAKALEPNSFEVYLMEANVLDALGQFGKALQTMKMAEVMADEEALESVYFGYGRIYLSLGQWDRALKFMRKSVWRNPNNELALYNLAFIYSQLDREKDGIAAFQKVIDLDPFNEIAWFNLGTLYNSTAQFDEALVAFDYAALLDEEFALAFFERGNALMNLEQYETALASFEQAIGIEPKDAMAACSLAACHEQLENWVEAERWYRFSSILDPNLSDAWYGLGVVADQAKDVPTAKSMLQKAIDLDPTVSDYWSALGHANWNLGEPTLAVQAFEQALLLEETNVDARLDFAFVLMEGDREQEALALLRAGTVLHAQNPEIHYRLSAYLLQCRADAEGLLMLQKSLQLSPDTAMAELTEYSPSALKHPTVLSLLSRYGVDRSQNGLTA